MKSRVAVTHQTDEYAFVWMDNDVAETIKQIDGVVKVSRIDSDPEGRYFVMIDPRYRADDVRDAIIKAGEEQHGNAG